MMGTDKKPLKGILIVSMVVLFILLGTRLAYFGLAAILMSHGWFFGLGAYLIATIAIIVAAIVFLTKRSHMVKVMVISLAVLDVFASVIMYLELLNAAIIRSGGLFFAGVILGAALYLIWLVVLFRSKPAKDILSDRVDTRGAERYEETLVAARINANSKDTEE